MRDGTRTRARRSTTTVYNYYSQALTQFYLQDTAPQHSFKRKAKKRPPSKTRGSDWTSWVFMAWDLADRKSHETVQVTCTLEVPRWGDPRRPVPTAASVAAVEPRLCQGEMIRAPAGNALKERAGLLEGQGYGQLLTPLA